MTEPARGDGRHDNPEVRHETRDIDLRAILLAAGALVAVAVVIQIVGWGLFAYLDRRERQAKEPTFPLATGRAAFPEDAVVLEGVKRMEGEEVYVRPEDLWPENQPRLNGYGWADEGKGVVRIPVAEAMRLLAEEGRLPARKGGAPWPRWGWELPSGASSGRTAYERVP